MSDAYLRQVLAQYAVDVGPYSPVRQVQVHIVPVIQRWGGQLWAMSRPATRFMFELIARLQ